MPKPDGHAVGQVGKTINSKATFMCISSSTARSRASLNFKKHPFLSTLIFVRWSVVEARAVVLQRTAEIDYQGAHTRQTISRWRTIFRPKPSNEAIALLLSDKPRHDQQRSCTSFFTISEVQITNWLAVYSEP